MINNSTLSPRKYLYQIISKLNQWFGCCLNVFLYAHLKNETYYGNTCRRAASTGFPVSKSKSFHQVFIKLGEYVGVHNFSTKFYNQPNPHRHSCIMVVEWSKIRVSALKVKELLSSLYQTW